MKKPLILTLAGSKSITNRIVTLAGMSNHPVLIKNFLISDDTNVGIECLKKLGFEIFKLTAESVLISPPNFEKLNKINFYDKIFELNMGNAGTMARFFPAVVLNWTKTFPNSKPISAFFYANSQLQKRPILPLIQALQKLGANIEGENYPFKISSSNLSGEVEINTEQSSQFLSGLLFAEYGSKNKITLKQTSVLPQPDYVLMTNDTIIKFKNHLNQKTKTTLEFYVEPDASTACYFLALAFLHNFSLTIDGLGANSLQPDVLFCNFLKKMGAHIVLHDNQITIHKRDTNKIKGGFSYDFSKISDQALTAGVLALFADEPIEITGVAHIRHHESNRIGRLVQNFQKFGFSIQEKKDGFISYPAKKIPRGVWETHEDHRFAMSGILLSSFNKSIIIQDKNCVTKTSPHFFEKYVNGLQHRFLPSKSYYSQRNSF